MSYGEVARVGDRPVDRGWDGLVAGRERPGVLGEDPHRVSLEREAEVHHLDLVTGFLQRPGLRIERQDDHAVRLLILGQQLADDVALPYREGERG